MRKIIATLIILNFVATVPSYALKVIKSNNNDRIIRELSSSYNPRIIPEDYSPVELNKEIIRMEENVTEMRQKTQPQEVEPIVDEIPIVEPEIEKVETQLPVAEDNQVQQLPSEQPQLPSLQKVEITQEEQPLQETQLNDEISEVKTQSQDTLTQETTIKETNKSNVGWLINSVREDIVGARWIYPNEETQAQIQNATFEEPASLPELSDEIEAGQNTIREEILPAETQQAEISEPVLDEVN